MAWLGSDLPLKLQTFVARSGEMVESEVSGEVVALRLQTGACYGFNKVGSRVWRMLERPCRIGDICSELEREFDVAPSVCQAQVVELLEGLRAEGLIEPVGLPSHPAAA